jgi:ABC-type oligopeptide transport system substrate-binding subunit
VRIGTKRQTRSRSSRGLGDVSERTVYTFSLRSNATWSTGQPITAADVVYSWLVSSGIPHCRRLCRTIVYSKTRRLIIRARWRRRRSVRALDERRVRVELEYPVAFFLDLCCFPTLAVVQRNDRAARRSLVECTSPALQRSLLNWSVAAQ